MFLNHKKSFVHQSIQQRGESSISVLLFAVFQPDKFTCYIYPVLRSFHLSIQLVFLKFHISQGFPVTRSRSLAPGGVCSKVTKSRVHSWLKLRTPWTWAAARPLLLAAVSVQLVICLTVSSPSPSSSLLGQHLTGTASATAEAPVGGYNLIVEFSA